jgi:murein DD-endopeptidase MepM/ murein hydrolase activator NlpD
MKEKRTLKNIYLKVLPIKSRCIASVLLLNIFLPSAYADYPEILSLVRSDMLFRQLQDDIGAYYRATYSGKPEMRPPLTFFTYTVQDSDDIFSVSARLNLPYETLATLNRIDNPEFFKDIGLLIIPNTPGIFVPFEPVSDLEQVMCSWRNDGEDGSDKDSDKDSDNAFEIVVKSKKKKYRFLFYAGSRFHPVERAYFLQILFRFPVPRGRVTSRFGKRKNPFSGHPEVHNGIDIGAPEGSEVFAARDGKVIKTGYDTVYGNYVLISHPGGYQSFYGHLKEICVPLMKEVSSGMVIGKVGTTGRSTGPHLHFEIRRNGKPQDPSSYMKRLR